MLPSQSVVSSRFDAYGPAESHSAVMGVSPPDFSEVRRPHVWPHVWNPSSSKVADTANTASSPSPSLLGPALRHGRRVFSPARHLASGREMVQRRLLRYMPSHRLEGSGESSPKFSSQLPAEARGMLNQLVRLLKMPFGAVRDVAGLLKRIVAYALSHPIAQGLIVAGLIAVAAYYHGYIKGLLTPETWTAANQQIFEKNEKNINQAILAARANKPNWTLSEILNM